MPPKGVGFSDPPIGDSKGAGREILGISPPIARNKVCVGSLEADGKRCTRFPTKRPQLGYVEYFSRRSVRTQWIENDFTAIANNLGNALRQISDRDLLPRADINGRFPRIAFEEEHAGVC